MAVNKVLREIKMNGINILFLFLSIIPAASFGWGMRGTTIGGEKGAMLPGALIGTLLAYFSGILIVQEYFYVFSALGAIGMYFGGCMTYGETLSFSISAYPAVDMKKGVTALFIKGFLWFGVFGAVFSTGINAVCGIYNLWQIILLIILTPALSILCLNKINRPHDYSQAIFPKIYFSKTRKECFGALVGMVLSFLIINITCLNFYSIIFTLICGLFGAIGWIIGQGSYVYIRYHSCKSSLKLIRFFSEKNGIDGWKSMECTFGAIGGLGCAVAFIITYGSFKETVFNLEIQGSIIPLNKTLSVVLFIIWLVLLTADMAHYFIKKPQLQPVFEAVEFILYAALPYVMITLGCDKTARAVALFLLFWVLAQEVAFEKGFKKVYLIILRIILSLCGVGMLITSVFISDISVFLIITVYTVIYEVLTLLWLVPEIIGKSSNNSTLQLNNSNVKDSLKILIKDKGTIVTHTYFLITIATVIIILV